MSTLNEHIADTRDREIITTLTFNAPRTLVFKAWTDPVYLAQWWGPTGFTNTFQEFVFRPGGIWRFIMHSPDGVDYPNESVFVEIIEPERIVFNHVTGPKFQVTATLIEQADKTQMTFRMLFDSATECEKVKPLAIDRNKQTFDRLEAVLA